MTVHTPSPAQIRLSWDAVAAGYAAGVSRHNEALAERALDRVDIRPGVRLLDVATGAGAVAVPAARRGAQVVATDISPAMIERLQERARAEDLSGIEARVGDGCALEFADDTFDIAASQFGVMLFPDLPRGLAELARVTRPGGQVLMVVFSAPNKQEWLGYFIGAIKAVVPGHPGLPADQPPLPFQVSDPQKLRQELERAGLSDVTIETVQHELAFQSGAELYDTVATSNPIGAAQVADLSTQQRAEVTQVLDRMLRERSGDGPGGVITSEVHIAVARS